MGDGGLGIGGAHILEACRRNLDLTLLILNNFNFGMTGGQFSATTPPTAKVGSGFLNRIEKTHGIRDPWPWPQVPPMWCGCRPMKRRQRKRSKKPSNSKASAWLICGGSCPGRYTKKNRLNPGLIKEEMDKRPPLTGLIEANQRPEYSAAYRDEGAALPKPQDPVGDRETV